jgi:hypothetical protein
VPAACGIVDSGRVAGWADADLQRVRSGIHIKGAGVP